MKKWIAWLLLAGMLLLAACNTVEDTSNGASSAESVSQETLSADQSDSQGTYRTTVVSVGKPYTVSSQPESRYADLFGTQLTDGQKAYDTATHYTDVRLVGYTQDLRIDVDLGEDGKAVTGAAVRALDINTDGVKLAERIRVYVSKTGDSGDWQNMGRVKFEPTGDRTMSTAALLFEAPVDCRYVRFSVSLASGAAFFFLDEVEVYADVDPAEQVNNGDAVYLAGGVDTNAWKALSTGNTASVADYINVAYGNTYTFKDCTFDTRAPEDKKFLTDGARTSRRFGDNVWVGFSTAGTPSIQLTLSEKYDNLYGFRLHMLGAGLDVEYPGAIDVYGSADNKTFTLLGRIYAPGNVANQAYTLLLPEYIEARYFRFDFVGGDGEGYYWIEEIEVLAGFDEKQPDEHFPELNFPIVTEDEYWDSSEADYNTYQNMLLGLTQQVSSTDYVATVNPHLSAPLSPADAPMLTDGKHGNVQSCYSDGWFFFHGGQTVDFFYDMGKLSTIDKVSFSLLEYGSWGIQRPKFHSILLSDDGENWYRVADYQRPSMTSEDFEDAACLHFEYELDKAYAARFVRFRIECSGFLFLDEFEAYGTKQVKSSAVRLADTNLPMSVYYTNPERTQHASVENTDVNASDIALLWGGNEGGDDMLMGFAAYLDTEGNIKDTMMDGFMYFPDNYLPTGTKGYQAAGKRDFEYMFETTFDGKNGLDKLEEVVGQIKDTLNRPDYKVYVYFPLLRLCDISNASLDPVGNVKNFGELDGEKMDTTISAHRVKIYNWYVEMVKTEFASRGYEHIVLDGFCWVNEDVGYEFDDSHIITEAGDVCEAAGMPMLWIPYYTANRYHLGHEMGVDVTNMQPNYMFDLEQPEHQLLVTATRTKWMKMCVEMEHNFEAFADPLFLRNYMLYLYYGVEYGYDKAIHIYYDNIDNIAVMAYSDDPMYRFQYDATYQFLKGTLDIYPDAKETMTFAVGKDTILDGTLNPEADFALYTLSGYTANGSVALSTDGTFRYYPNQGFTGTDSFTYTYNNYLGESETCTVEITVK